MNSLALVVKVVILSGALVHSLSTVAQTNFTDFIVFGDSLSDTGNINSGLPDLPPPFFNNRISNGPVGADYIAESIGFSALASERGGNNYAVAGGNIVGSDREDLASQIDDYLADVDNQADPTALYFVMIGGNDLRDLRSQTSLPLAETSIDGMISAYIQQFTRLKSAGARRFAVANVADVGRIPETLMKESSDPGVGLRVSQYVQIFNARLSSALELFSAEQEVTVVEFDLFSEFNTILDSPASYGFNYTTIGCVDISSEDILDLLVSIIFPYTPECLAGLRFDEFVFFDNLHPSKATNQLIGASMVELIANSTFPLPNAPDRSIITAITALLLLLDD